MSFNGYYKGKFMLWQMARVTYTSSQIQNWLQESSYQSKFVRNFAQIMVYEYGLMDRVILTPRTGHCTESWVWDQSVFGILNIEIKVL